MKIIIITDEIIAVYNPFAHASATISNGSQISLSTNKYLFINSVQINANIKVQCTKIINNIFKNVHKTINN